METDCNCKNLLLFKFIEFSGSITISIYMDYQDFTYGYVNKIDSWTIRILRMVT